ncbi:MAG: tetratricopeptide repeat protein [Bacteroidetes bacterium]|nr:tetratricopeptide repeat protein [Bacteroidota bacterium]
MKKSIFSLICLGFLSYANAQSAKVDFSQKPPNIDSLLPKIAAEKNDSARYYLAMSALTISETNPVEDMHNSEIILLHGQKNNDLVCQVLGYCCLCYDYIQFGNKIKSLEFGIKANQVAEKSKNDRLITFAKAMLALTYLTLGDFEKAVSYNMAALEAGSKYETDIISVCAVNDMGIIYLAMGKTDSALIYTQKAYELAIKSNITYWLTSTYLQFGSIHSALKNSSLALNYWNLAVEEAKRIGSPKFVSTAYNAIAQFYYSANQKDSAKLYASKAINSVANTAFYTLNVEPAKLLLNIYRNANTDSAFKYSEIYRAANDSLFNIRTLQQAQLMAVEEEARIAGLKLEEEKEEEARKVNLEYTFIALGIIAFLMLFILFSRKHITNTNVIKFLSVVSLLIVFEFINLLIHPLLEKITHYSPLLMLLSLVGVAAIIIPFHQKLEHWAVTKLIENNRRARLEAAKRTIEQLEV